MIDITTTKEFQAAVAGKPLAVICFHSARSAYSRRTVQSLMEIEPELPGRKFHLLDADRETLFPVLLECQVVGLPTIQIFRLGVRAEFLVGERSKEVLARLLANLLA